MDSPFLVRSQRPPAEANLVDECNNHSPAGSVRSFPKPSATSGFLITPSCRPVVRTTSLRIENTRVVRICQTALPKRNP
jgi:hypothetical protein